MSRRLTPIFVSFLLLTGCPTTPEEVPDPSAAFDVIESTERPSKRSEPISVADEDSGLMLMFGGNEAAIVNQSPGAEYMDETWTFEPGYGWREIGGDAPHARGRHTGTLDRAAGRALMFGGRYRPTGQSGAYTLYADLWGFDFASGDWTELDDGAGGPAPRYYPQSAWSTTDDALYIFGGLTNTDPLSFQRNDELWRWSESDGWSEIPTSGDTPSLRAFYGTTYDSSRNRMILFAGQIGDFQSLAFNDLYALDLGTGVWTELHGGGMGAPFTRMHPHVLYDDARDRVLMFGGHTDIGDDNDLWAFPGGGSEWELVDEADVFTGEPLGCLDNSAEVPADYVDQDLDAPERRHKAFIALMFDNLWIFGGMHAECSEHLDDTWRYDLESQTWSELISARTGESCARRGDDCDCLCL